MGKVVTSQGLQDFIATGKPTEIIESKAKVIPPKEDPKPEVKTEPKVENTEKQVVADAKAEVELEGLEPGDKEFTQAVQKRINAKHRAMKEAQTAAEDAERFAETQYNERMLANKRAEAAEARTAELEAQTKKSEPAPELTEPDDQDPQFKDAAGNFDWRKYAKALAAYEAKQALKASEAAREEERSAQERVEMEQKVKASVNRARAAFPDFDQVMKSAEGTEADRVPQYILNYLSESDEAGFVAYHLAKHPEDTQRIAQMKPILGLAELGKLADKLVTKEPPKEDPKPALQRGGAPEPITPINSGNAGVNTDPAKMSYKELREYERNRARAKQH